MCMQLPRPNAAQPKSLQKVKDASCMVACEGNKYLSNVNNWVELSPATDLSSQIPSN